MITAIYQQYDSEDRKVGGSYSKSFANLSEQIAWERQNPEHAFMSYDRSEPPRDVTIRTFFKKIVKDAARPMGEQETVLRCGSQSPEWFEVKAGRKSRQGKYAYLTDDYIDKTPLEKIEEEMMLFIVDCFRQR